MDRRQRGVARQGFVVALQRGFKARQRHADDLGEFGQRIGFFDDIAARILVIGQIGIADPRCGRDKIRPLIELSGDLMPEHDPARSGGLPADMVLRAVELVAKAFALLVDQDRAFVKQIVRGGQKGRDKAQQEGPHQHRRHHFHRPHHQLGE